MLNCVQSHICYLSTQQQRVTTSMLWAILELPLHLWKEASMCLQELTEPSWTGTLSTVPHAGGHTPPQHLAQVSTTVQERQAHGIPSPTLPKPQHSGDLCYPPQSDKLSSNLLYSTLSQQETKYFPTSCWKTNFPLSLRPPNQEPKAQI